MRPLRMPSRARVKGYESCQYNGAIYHSRMEARYAQQLDTLKTARDPREQVASWARQIKVSLDVNGQHICNWFVDFEVTYADGRVELHEVKGFATETYRLKRKLFEALYPERVLRVIK